MEVYMEVHVVVPDDVAQRFKDRLQDINQYTLEALAAEGYRSGLITEAEVQRMLELPSRWQVDEFLARSRAYSDYTEADLQSDIDSIRKLARS
jgi:hypothetical protein